MSISVQPIRLTYSFAANAKQASDKVDLVALDAQLALLTGKVNEIITALETTLRDDNTLDDYTVESRHLADDTLEEITSIVNDGIRKALP